MFRTKRKAVWKRPEDGEKLTVVVLQELDSRAEIRTQRVDGVPVVLWVNVRDLEEIA